MQEICVICLNGSESLKNLSTSDSHDQNLIANLRKCVPEVDWKDALKTCPPCLDQLRNVCAFRELCIRSHLTRIKAETEEPDEKKFVCFHCEQQFDVKSVLADHIRAKHDKKKTHDCPNCPKTFKTEPSLKKHSKICPEKIEPKVTDDNNEEEGDFKSEPEEIKDLNACNLCGTTFGNKYLLKRHVRNVHATEKKYKCDECERKFASPVYLNAHKRYHRGERRHICPFCGKGYITASDLYHHEKIHANKRAYRCEVCPKAFNTSSDLHKHRICVHLDRAEWKHECAFCGRRFPLKTNLDAHTKTHTGERNFLCHLCDRRCINRSVLRRHVDSHAVVKSFKCQLCCHGYKYQRSLDVHMMKAHGIGDLKLPVKVKKYFCGSCPKSYFANNKLQKHMRSHTGERPFRCPACDKSFVDKSYVKTHLKTAHGAVDFKV